MSKSLSILVVDDHETIRDLFTNLLKPTEHQLFTAEGGEKAIEIAQSNSLDIAFLDMRMPVMDGLDTLRALKEIHSNLVFVIITGYADEDRIDAAMKEGAITCLKKPFGIKDIRTLLGKVSEENQGRPNKILLLNQDPDITKLFEQLPSSEHEITAVCKASEAFDRLNLEPFDLVFVDLLLPGVSGIEASKHIHKNYPTVRIVLLTGATDQKDLLKSIGAGAVQTLEKPFSIEEIRKILDHLS